ncbi:GPI transamidase subunit PIG-U-domain-containing protein [Scenedesmus sp. NREL 46B-D3]|nr:GPI transamidase subunit PIG-U-domain-containing protein [Scenedesmus sp. NREL 46B-D3]
MLQQHPQAQCLPAASHWVQRQVGLTHSQQQQQQQRHLQLHSCWAVRVYKLPLLLEDYTPNIGLWWYFFTEMFAAYRPFFLFVFHSFAVILAVPVAIRFSRRPLFVAWVQLFISCMFKPYESVADMVPWMALLPLLQQQLQCVKAGLFFVNSFVLLLVLGPAMWHQWINVDAANSNFFYSITLLLGVWCTVLLTHLVRLTALLDRRLAGKRLELEVDDLDDDDGSLPPGTAVDGSAAAAAVAEKDKDA